MKNFWGIVGGAGALIGTFFGGYQFAKIDVDELVKSADEVGFVRGRSEAERDFANRNAQTEALARVINILGSSNIEDILSKTEIEAVAAANTAIKAGDYRVASDELRKIQIAAEVECVPIGGILKIIEGDIFRLCDVNHLILVLSVERDKVILKLNGERNLVRYGDRDRFYYYPGCAATYERRFEDSEPREAGVRIECQVEGK